jgi:integrase/recombinase XerD
MAIIPKGIWLHDDAGERVIDVHAMFTGLRSPKTAADYTRLWRQYVIFCGSEEAALEAYNLVRYRQHLIVVKQRSANTINTALRAIKSIIRQLRQQGVVTRDAVYDFTEVNELPANALVERRRPNNRVRVSTEEVKRMVDAPPASINDYVACMHRALLMTLASTGLRAAEVGRVKLDHIERRAGGYVITNVIGKHQGQAREVPLAKGAYDAIQDWLHVRPVYSEYVFFAMKVRPKSTLLISDDPMPGSTVLTAVRKYAKIAGIAHLKTHDLRRYVGTQLAKVDLRVAQKVLGHQDINTTASSYVLDDTPVGVTDGLI